MQGVPGELDNLVPLGNVLRMCDVLTTAKKGKEFFMSRGMLSTDLFRIRWVSDARLSPDGGRLAFLSDRQGGKAQVYVIDITGGEAHKLTSIPQGAGAPVWSPDGMRLVRRGRGGRRARAAHSRWWRPRAAGVVARRTDDGVPGLRRRGGCTPSQPSVAGPGGWRHPRCLTVGFGRHLEIADTAAPIWWRDGSALIVGLQDRGMVGVIQVQVADGTVTPLVSGRGSVSAFGVAGTTVMGETFGA